MPDSVLGIGIELLGTLLSVMGLNSMKYAAMLPAPESTNKYLSSRFAGSLLLYTSGQLIEVVALAFGNSAVLSACSASALVWNAILANRVFGEKFTLLDGSATFAICAGIVLSAVFGPPNHDLTPHQFEENASHAQFMAFCAGLAVMVFVCLTLIFKSMNHAESSSSGAVVYSVLTASIGSFCYFLGSVNSQLIKHTLKEKESPKLFQVVLIFVFVCLCISNLYFINKALARFEALVFVPVYYVLNILFTVFGCLVFYDDFDNLYPPVYKTVFFSAGVLAILIGVRVLSLREAGSTSRELPESLNDELLSPCHLHVSRNPLSPSELRRSLASDDDSQLPSPLQKRRRTWTVVTAHTGFSGGVLLPPTSQLPSLIGSRTLVRSGSGSLGPMPSTRSCLQDSEDRAQSDDGVSPSSLEERRETSPV